MTETLEVASSPYPLVFLRCRTIAFCAITFFSFAWIVLLCIVIFMQWEFMNRSYQSILVVMIIIYALTLVLLLVMLTLRFRPWLDAARFLFLVCAHFGVSGAFALYSPQFTCPQPTVEDKGVCRMLILYILISSWLLPLLIVIYSFALAVMAAYRWHLARTGGSNFDAEKDSLDLKRELHKSQLSSFIGSPPTPTPIAAHFARPQLDIPNRFTSMPTPTTVDFSSYYATSPVRASPVDTPTSASFPVYAQPYWVPPGDTQLPYLMPSASPQRPYLMPPPHHHLNAHPPPTRSRHHSISTTLHESIPEESSSISGDSYNEKRASTRLYKPSRSSRLPSL